MTPHVDALDQLTGAFGELGLLSQTERVQTRSLLDGEFAFAEAVAVAQSIHLHVKVDDVAALPHDRIQGMTVDGHQVVSENGADGYVKCSWPGGVNMIFSSIPVAADDLIDGAVTTARPFLDHAGVDIRVEDVVHRTVFDSVPALGWRRVSQEGPVFCCHTKTTSFLIHSR